MQSRSIQTTRQPRLPLPGSQETWLEEVWETLPPDAQRDALHQLARLLVSWFGAQERRQ